MLRLRCLFSEYFVLHCKVCLELRRIVLLGMPEVRHDV